eukprot:scaffold52525_cov75-Phaeocystis_antarctica.AAC.3
MSHQLLRGVRSGRHGRLGCVRLRRRHAHPRPLAPRIGRNVGRWIWPIWSRRRHRRCRPRVSRRAYYWWTAGRWLTGGRLTGGHGAPRTTDAQRACVELR